jgi:hypothetical protein
MPIEIRELHIKAVIDSGGGKKSAGSAETAEGEKAAGPSEQNSEQLIDICVEKVLEILKQKTER